MVGQDAVTQPPGEAGRHGRRIKHFLLDRHFQLKYTAMILGVATVISLGLGAFLIAKIRENSRMLRIDELADDPFQRQLAAADTRMMLVLVGAFLLFLLL